MKMFKLSWIAVIILSVSYWFQIYRIHVHKEVRDLSIPYYCLLAIGFLILTYTAHIQGSSIFFVKQIATTIPIIIIIGQIFYHRKDHWHDDEDPICRYCESEGELDWSFCAYCGRSYEADVKKAI